ncbi:hypothetical protein JB92DRAFT_2988743 [Gautieria morchelliformis]|nr:hypothetical protein JB92DRAFT_2988743 [Gautieria morchelliformis]
MCMTQRNRLQHVQFTFLWGRNMESVGLLPSGFPPDGAAVVAILRSLRLSFWPTVAKVCPSSH